MGKSEFICRRCLLPVRQFNGKWKHCASGTTGKSCRRTPKVVSRKVYEAENKEIESWRCICEGG